MNNQDDTLIVIRPLSKKQLAALYGVSPYVLRNWLQPLQEIIGKRKGYRYSVEQVIIVFEQLGFPQP